MTQNNFGPGPTFQQQQPQQWQQAPQQPQQWQQQPQQMSEEEQKMVNIQKSNEEATTGFNQMKQIELSSGQIVDIPRLNGRKVVKLAKAIAKDGAGIYFKYQKFGNDKRQAAIAAGQIPEDGHLAIEMEEVVAYLITEIEEEQLFSIVSILTGLPVEEALDMDFDDLLDVIISFMEHNNLEKSFTKVRKAAEPIIKLLVQKGQSQPEFLNNHLR